MSNIKTNNLTIGEIVANDFRAANIFMEAGIDFCCGGNKTLDDACTEKGINLSNIEESLGKLELTPNTEGTNFKDWDLDLLCDYIEKKHHRYVKKALPDLVHYTQKIASVHGANHPELAEIADLFGQINTELLQHLKNEEEVLFPAIKEAISNEDCKALATIRSEIERMSKEHEFAGGAMDKINELSKGYKVPADGCNTYNVTYNLLHQFEDDLHIHVHLENNILYPKALQL
jgi:regulator of cell morphogenesis and NO signaling